ncbi:hypothetical protein D3C84_1026020 [compost metagenome]
MLVHEKKLTFQPPYYGWHLKGGALKTLSIGWAAVVTQKPQIAPSVHKLPVSIPENNPSLGEMQFIDFTGADELMIDARIYDPAARRKSYQIAAQSLADLVN